MPVPDSHDLTPSQRRAAAIRLRQAVAPVAGLGDLFVPMLWGPSQAADFQRLVVAGYANAALGPNEYVKHVLF